MKYSDDPDYWEWVDMKQVETMERKLAQLDPDYIEDLKDPARAVRGIFYGILISVLFWSLLVGIVWLANTYL